MPAVCRCDAIGIWRFLVNIRWLDKRRGIFKTKDLALSDEEFLFVVIVTLNSFTLRQ